MFVSRCFIVKLLLPQINLSSVLLVSTRWNGIERLHCRRIILDCHANLVGTESSSQAHTGFSDSDPKLLQANRAIDRLEFTASWVAGVSGLLWAVVVLVTEDDVVVAAVAAAAAASRSGDVVVAG